MTSVRVLAAAAMAVVVAVAALTAEAPLAAETSPPLAFRAVMPGLSADAGTPPSSAGAVWATHLYERLEGGLVVSGEVVNASNSHITNVRVRITHTFEGKSETIETTSLVTTIAPGGVGPFRATFAGVTTLAGTVTAEVISYEPAPSPAPAANIAITGPYPFQVGPPDPKTGVIPYSTTLEQLRGAVTNTSDTALSAVEVVIVAYDGAGNVAFVTTSSELTVPFQQAGEPPVLQPGVTGSFTAGIPIGLLLELPGEVTLRGFLNATGH